MSDLVRFIVCVRDVSDIGFVKMHLEEMADDLTLELPDGFVDHNVPGTASKESYQHVFSTILEYEPKYRMRRPPVIPKAIRQYVSFVRLA